MWVAFVEGTLRRDALRRSCPPKAAVGHFLLLNFALQGTPSQHARNGFGFPALQASRHRQAACVGYL